MFIQYIYINEVKQLLPKLNMSFCLAFEHECVQLLWIHIYFKTWYSANICLKWFVTSEFNCKKSFLKIDLTIKGNIVQLVLFNKSSNVA